MITPELGLAGAFVLLLLLVLGLIVVFYFVPLPLRIAAWASGAYVGVLISAGMLIPGNVPNIIAAHALHITSTEWAKLGVPLGQSERRRILVWVTK